MIDVFTTQNNAALVGDVKEYGECILAHSKVSQGVMLSLAALTVFGGLTPSHAIDPAPSGAGTEAESTNIPLATTDALTKKIEEAKALGINVEMKDVKHLTTNYTGIEAAQKEGDDYQNEQIKSLDEAIVQQKALDSEFQLATENRARVIAENEKIAEQNAQNKADYDAATAARDAALKAKEERDAKAAEIEKSNDDALKKYAEAQLAFEEALKQWTAQVQQINAQNTETNQKNAGRLTPLISAVVDAKDDTARDAAVKAYNDEVSKIESENAVIEEQNKAKLAQYEADLVEAERLKAESEEFAKEIDAKNAQLRADFEKAMEEYNVKLEEYNKAVGENQAAIDAQLNSDPYTALRPSELFIKNPFSMNPNPNNLINISQENAVERGTGSNWYDMGSTYNSETIHKYQVNPGSIIRAEYGNVATDTESGRALNVRLTYDNFHVVQNNVDLPQFGVPAEAGQSVQAFTNYMDAVAIQGITYYQAQFDFYYADTGESYDKPYYLTTGSLHGVKDTQIDQTGNVNPSIPVDATGHYEFSGPVSGVRSSMINPGSIIADSAQPINTHEGELGRAFMIQQGTDYYMDHGRTSPIGDESNEALSVLGVTYLVDNGARLAFGVSSAVPGADYDPTINWYNGGPVGYNHVMLSADTVAPMSTTTIPDKPVPPKEPDHDPGIPPTVPLPEPPVLEEIDPVAPIPNAPDIPEEPVTQTPPPDVDIPDVPPYTEIPPLDVPDEPQREYVTALAGFADLAYLPTDVRVAKTAVDMDASDGQVSWLVEGGNWGQGAATDVVVKDTFGQGVTSINLSELKLNGEDVVEDRGALSEDGATFSTLNPEDRFSFVVTAEVDPNADTIKNAVGITTPDDPNKGKDCETDPQLNNKPDEDTDGCDVETSRVIQKAELKIHKEMMSFDEATMTATYKVTGGNFGAIAHDITIEDFGGQGIKEVRVKSFQAVAPTSSEAPTSEESVPSTEPSAEPTVEPSQDSAAKPSTSATDEATVAADLTPVSDVEIPDLVTPQPSVTENVPPSATPEPSESATPTETEAIQTETGFGTGRGNYDREALILDAADQPNAVGADVTILDDYVIEGNTVRVDAMGKDETFEMIVEVSLEDTARFIDNKVGITSPSDPNAKGKDGSQPNDDVPSDNDGWDIAETELDRPADLRVNKVAVDGDASDGKVTYRIEGANLGIGDSPETDILDEDRVGLLNPVISNVTVDGQPANDTEFTIYGTDSTTGEKVEASTTEKLGIQVNNLKAGQTYTYDVTFDVDRSSETISNAAAIDSPKDPVDRSKDIQENDDIPGDEDQRDKLEIPVTPIDLRVNKSVLDGDASDGKVSFLIEGANLGTGTATEVDITDADYVGLENPVISEVKVNDTALVTEEYTLLGDGASGIRLNQLAGNDTASYVVEFDVAADAQEISNAARITSPDDPVDPNKDIQENEDLPGDNDQQDKVSIDVPPAPETPQPSEPAPSEPPAPEPSVSQTPAQSESPAPETPAPSKGTWGTGAGAVVGVSAVGLLALLVGGYSLYRYRGRSAE